MASKGRPTKLTPDMQKRICEAIKLGMSRERAAWFCGIDRVTLQRWLKAAEGRASGKYVDFCNSLKKAEADAIAVNLKNLHTAAQNGAWQASAWMLERRYPQEYGRNVNITDDASKRVADAIENLRVKEDHDAK